MCANKADTIFVGPTLQGCSDVQSALADSFNIMPPVKRGDVLHLMRVSLPATLVIVDGLFHGCLSVGHAEIRDAVHNGWDVWGVSSMGAIRACEMRDFGMKGFGRVYQRYVVEEDFQDDEVALMHGPFPPYPALSEPLIHMRVALEELQQHRYLSSAKAKKITAHLKSLWYGKRTLDLFQSLVMKSIERKKRAAAAEFLIPFSRFRVKTLDLKQFLEEQPWKDRSKTSHLP